MHVCIPYLVKSKGLVSEWLPKKNLFENTYRRMMLNGIKRSMVFFFCLSSFFLSFLSFPFFPSIFFFSFFFFPLPSHGFGFEHHASVPNFPNSSLSGVHPFPSSKHFPSYISISNISLLPPYFFFPFPSLLSLLCFRLLCVCKKKLTR